MAKTKKINFDEFGTATIAQPPTPESHFEDKPMLLHFMASCAITEESYEKDLSEQDKEWFCNWGECRLRWLHANKKDWRRHLERQSNKDRDIVLAFLHHWAKAFLLDVKHFKTRYPIAEETPCAKP
jgi:hypothetical protein